jgi:predicted dehydrogenase
MSYSKTINAGILAFGMSGKVFHAPFLDRHVGFNLYAVTERTTKKAVTDYPQLHSYHSGEELLNDPAIELVVVNTPSCLHHEHAKAALLKGKHVLVEKPFTATTQQAKELFALADKQGKQIFFFQNRRWDSDFLAAKEVIESGCLGELVEMHFRYDLYRPAIGPKFFKEEADKPASGLFYDLGPHLLDQAISLFGKPTTYRKTGGKHRKNTQVTDYFFIQLNYPHDLLVTVAASLLVVNPQPAFVVHGTSGSFVKHRVNLQEQQLLGGMKLNDPVYGIEPPDKQGILSTANSDGSIAQQLVPSKAGSYLPLFDAIYESLVHNVPYPITRDDILTQLEILEA